MLTKISIILFGIAVASLLLSALIKAGERGECAAWARYSSESRRAGLASYEWQKGQCAAYGIELGY